MALPAHSGPRPFIQFPNHFSQMVELLGRLISPSQGFYLDTGHHKHRKSAQTLIHWVGFEPTIPASERAKAVHGLDRAATMTGFLEFNDLSLWTVSNREEGEAIPVTGHGGPEGCETSRLPHYLDNRLTDGGKVVSRPLPHPPEDSWYSFLLEAESTPRS
jgi:hypothetical protein